MGMAPYLANLTQLGLDEYQLFNAQSNRFDRATIANRLRAGVAAWIQGAEVPCHPCPAPDAVLRVYDALRAAVVRAGLPACPRPFLLTFEKPC